MHRIRSILLLWAIITLAHGAEPAKDKASPQSPTPAPALVDLDAKARLIQKMDEIIIPSVHFKNATLEQALDFLRKKSRELDKSPAPDGTKGVSLTLREPAPPKEIRITLDLKEAPLSEALRYVAELTNLVYRVEAQGVVLTDMHAYRHERHTRTFKVPPDFLSVGGGEASDAPADPFAPSAPNPPPSAGLIPRKTAQQILEASGITFPEGSSASFNPLTNLLRVTNTQPNLDLVEAYTESCCYNPPKVIAFSLTIFEAPGDLIRQINAEASKTANASKQLTSLRDLAQKPDSSVRVAGHTFIETKSGISATTEAESAPRLSNSVSPDPDRQPTGLRIQLEPTIQADGQTIDLSLDLELSPPLSAKTEEPNLSPPPANNTSLETTREIPKVNLTSSLLVSSGTTKLAGIARPPGLPQKTDDILWAVFLTTSVRYVENPPHHLALGTHSTSTPPKGLSSITFQITEGLFESIMDPTPKPLRDWFIDQGVTFPSGSVIKLENDLLRITNTQENIDSISMLIAAAVQKASKTVAVTLHTVRLPPSSLPKLSQAALTSADQSAEWKEVEAAAARGEAAFLESSFFETKSGTRSTHVAARDCYFLDRTPPKEKNPPAISIKGRPLGSFLKIEPTIGADGRTIDVTYNHELHVPVGVPDAIPPHDPAQGQSIPLPSTSFRVLKTHSHTTMHEGEIRLIALHQDISSSHADHIWATFLQCCTVPHFPKPKKALANQIPPQAGKEALETRAYRVPADFVHRLISLGAPSPAPSGDPFAIEATQAPRRRERPPRPLEDLGVTFPEGASVSYNPKTSTLIMRNTLANHALITAVVDKILSSMPFSVAFTTHVLQGPGPLLRRLAAQASRKSDHRAELDELLAAVKSGTVLHLDTARLETKPGTRATVNQGSEHPYICELSLDDKGLPLFKKEPRCIGLNVELEPTTSKDSPFVDLIISAEYHTAPPLDHREHLIAPQGRRLDFPLTDLFTSKTVTAITLPSTSARLLSLYKPTGKPEFEKQDILQAIFITCDILRLEDPTVLK
ncbi:hypothetical protein [Prosthecobacter fluviatilis]|uniref:Uncharacterized protein n=1 Tax=Prosthecobacter fluviatilis TaxID=445931 RepID=A0ABW0KQ48_9BACT